jgi:hypothetical protein
MSSLTENWVCVTHLNALKFSQWEGVQGEWKEVGEQSQTTRIKVLSVYPLGKEPWLPLYRVWGQGAYKVKGSLVLGVMSLKEGN